LFVQTMITLLYHVQSLRWIVPAAFMLGTAPVYCAVWGCCRVLTSVLPSRVFKVADDTMYSLYQRLVLFFFEYCTGVEVCSACLVVVLCPVFRDNLARRTRQAVLEITADHAEYTASDTNDKIVLFSN